MEQLNSYITFKFIYINWIYLEKPKENTVFPANFVGGVYKILTYIIVIILCFTY